MFLSPFYILAVLWADNMKEGRITNLAGIISAKSHISRYKSDRLCSADILRSVYVLCCCLLQIRPVAWVICCRGTHQQLEELNRFPGALPALLQGSFAIPSVQFAVFNDALYFYWILISQCRLMRRMETKAKAIGGGDEKSLWLCYTCCKRREREREKKKRAVCVCVCVCGFRAIYQADIGLWIKPEERPVSID